MYREWDRCGFWQFVPLQHCSRYCFVFCLWECCFWPEEKKTMLLPTLFTSLVLVELLIVLAVFPALYPFLLSGIYFFTLLHGVAWILILTGWITGGYRPPEKQGNEQIKREKNPKRSGHGWRRKNPTGGESRKRNAAGKRIIPQKRRIQPETKHSSGNIVRFPMTLRNRHTG